MIAITLIGVMCLGLAHVRAGKPAQNIIITNVLLSKYVCTLFCALSGVHVHDSPTKFGS